MVASTQRSDYPAGENNPQLVEQCQAAIEALDQALEAEPEDIAEGEAAAVALRAATHFRDTLIERLRATPHAAEAGERRTALNQVNTAISLIARVEYPRTRVAPKSLEDARRLLQNLRTGGLP